MDEAVPPFLAPDELIERSQPTPRTGWFWYAMTGFAAVVLGARPKDLTRPDMIAEFLSQRTADATAYWEANFQPIINGPSAAEASVK